MKFIALSQAEEITDPVVLREEFKAAKQAGEGRLGKKHLFYRYFIRVKYLSYEKIQKAYLRVESGETGEFLLMEFYLILSLADGLERKLRFEREENVRAVLACLEENYPQIEVGYKKDRPDKPIQKEG